MGIFWRCYVFWPVGAQRMQQLAVGFEQVGHSQQIVCIDPADFGYFGGVGRQRLAVAGYHVPVEEEPAVGDFGGSDLADDLDGRTEFFLPFAMEGLGFGFARFDAAAWETPEIAVGDRGGAAREKDLAVAAPDAGYADSLKSVWGRVHVVQVIGDAGRRQLMNV